MGALGRSRLAAADARGCSPTRSALAGGGRGGAGGGRRGVRGGRASGRADRRSRPAAPRGPCGAWSARSTRGGLSRGGRGAVAAEAREDHEALQRPAAAREDAARRRDPVRRGAAAARPVTSSSPAAACAKARRSRSSAPLLPRTPRRAGPGARAPRRASSLTSSTAVAPFFGFSPSSICARSPWTQATAARRGRGRARARPPRRLLPRARRRPRPRGSAPRASGSTDCTQRTYGLERIRSKSRSASCVDERLGLPLPALVERPQGVVVAVPGRPVARPRVADEVDDHAQASSAARSSSRQASGSSARASAPAPALTLDEASRREGRARTGRVGEQAAQPRLGDDRVLVGAEHVLECLRLLDERPRRLADLGLGQLGRVARALAEDAGPVQLVVGRVRPEPVGELAQALELLGGELAQRDLAALDARAARGRLQPVEQAVVALARQRVERDRLRGLALGGQKLDERSGGRPLGLLELLDLALQMARRARRCRGAARASCRASELVAQRLRPGRVEQRARGAEDRARSAAPPRAAGARLRGRDRAARQGHGAGSGRTAARASSAAGRSSRRSSRSGRSCSRGRSAPGWPRAGTPAARGDVGRRRDRAAELLDHERLVVSRGSSSRQMPLPCSRRRESVAPTSSSRRSGRS